MRVDAARTKPDAIESSAGFVGAGLRSGEDAGFWQQGMRQWVAHLPRQQQVRAAWWDGVDWQPPAVNRQAGRLPTHKPTSRLAMSRGRRMMAVALIGSPFKYTLGREF